MKSPPDTFAAATFLMAKTEGVESFMNWPPDNFVAAFVYTALFGLLGIGLVVLGFKIFDWLTPRLDIQHELTEKHNIAVAVLCAAIILGISLMVAAVIHG